MALINCPDCKKEVSSMAISCPNCGMAIVDAKEMKAIGTQAITIQETSKKMKAQIMLAWICIIVGLVWIYNTPRNQFDVGPWPGLLITLGLFWYIFTKFRIWWHHK